MAVTATPTPGTTSSPVKYDGRGRRTGNLLDGAAIPQIWAVVDEGRDGPRNVLGWVWTLGPRNAIGLQWFHGALYEFESLERLTVWLEKMSYPRAVLKPYAVTPLGTQPLPPVDGEPAE